MIFRRRTRGLLLFLPALLLGCVQDDGRVPDADPATGTAAGAPETNIQGEVPDMAEATGTFDVELAPVEAAPETPAFFERMTISKTWQGGLVGTSEALMLALRTEDPRQAGYVAMERFEGALSGREGTFVMQHEALMDGEAQHLRITVVPGTGTGELTGIRGTLSLEIGDEHRYTFAYDLPD